MQKLIATLLFMIVLKAGFAQEKTIGNKRLYIKPAVGLNIPITRLFSGNITDNLLNYADHAVIFQMPSATYMFSSNWGIEVGLQLGFSGDFQTRVNNLNSYFEEKYAADYFVLPVYGFNQQNNAGLYNSYWRGMFGLVYQIEKPKYLILSKFLIGSTDLQITPIRRDLKERGTNQVLKLSYFPDTKRNQSFFTLSTGLTLGYKISKRTWVNFDVQYAYSKSNFSIEEKLRNPLTEQTLQNNFVYKKDIHTLTIGVGLIYDILPLIY
jgi:hypothetical protein